MFWWCSCERKQGNEGQLAWAIPPAMQAVWTGMNSIFFGFFGVPNDFPGYV